MDEDAYVRHVDSLQAEVAALRRDADRYRWLRTRMLAADFDYGGDGTQVLIFEMPSAFAASADCDMTIDDAMQWSAVGAA